MLAPKIANEETRLTARRHAATFRQPSAKATVPKANTSTSMAPNATPPVPAAPQAQSS